MISGHGYSSAKIMLIADGATDSDIAQNKAITGYQEQKIRELAKPAGLNINECWKTCLIKGRINLNKVEENEPLVTDEFKAILKNEIDEINPTVIVPLSELSFRFVTGLRSIYKFRGSVLPAATGFKHSHRVIPVLGYHPYVSADPAKEFISRLDFIKVVKNQHLTGPIKEIGLTWIAKDANSLREFFKRHYRHSKFVVFDIETYAGVPTCISFCFDGNESVTVPLIDYRIPLDTRILMLREVSILLNSSIPKVNQNIKFDWRKCERFLLKVNNVSGDTILAASCLYPEFDKNLGFLTSIYTEMPYFKDEGKQFDPSIHNRDRLYLYCAKDSLATHQIYTQQLAEMEEMGVTKVYENLMKVFPYYRQMEDNGIRIDALEQSKLRSKYSSMFDTQCYKLELLLGEKINPLSNKQVRRIVYDELKYRICRGIKRTKKKGEPGTDEESLELLMWMSDYNSVRDGKDILRTIINCKKLHKVLEYIDTPLHLDHRLRCEYNLGGTVNGRTSANSTTDNLLMAEKNYIDLIDIGRSFQTIAKHGFMVDDIECGKDLRGMMVPSYGYSFVEGDLSQAEARVDAVLARDWKMLQVFDGPVGIHRLTGSWLYGCDPTQIKKSVLVGGVDQYHMAKQARHAGERNMQEDRLMMMIHQEIQECVRILRTFHENQPNIREVFHKEVDLHLKTKRMLRAPNGRFRAFYGRYDKNQVNEAISYLPQVIVSDQLKNAIPPTMEAAPWARPILEAHDGFLSEVPIGREEEYAVILKPHMESKIDFNVGSLSRDIKLSIPAEFEMSRSNWKEMKGFKVG